MARCTSTAKATASTTLDHAPVVFGRFRLDELSAKGLEGGERTRFVGGHEAAVADHVGGQNGRQPALGPIFGHGASPDPNTLSMAVYGSGLGESNGVVAPPLAG